MICLWRNPRVKNAMILAARGHPGGGGQRFLFELLPDLFPYGMYTAVENALWAKLDSELKDQLAAHKAR